MNKLVYPAILSFTSDGYVIVPSVNLYHVSGKRVDRIVLEDISEMSTGIPVPAVFAALTEEVEVLFTDRNNLHYIKPIKIL